MGWHHAAAAERISPTKRRVKASLARVRENIINFRAASRIAFMPYCRAPGMSIDLRHLNAFNRSAGISPAVTDGIYPIT
jgi:hypothetical protein